MGTMVVDYGRELEELKVLVTRALEKKGVLSSLKAQLRASVFEALEEQDRQTIASGGKPAVLASSNDTAKAFHKTQEGKDLSGLIQEYLLWAGLDHTLKVYLPEADLPDAPISRSGLAKELGLRPEGGTASLPLLAEVIRSLRVEEDPKTVADVDEASATPTGLPEAQPVASRAANGSDTVLRSSYKPDDTPDLLKQEDASTAAMPSGGFNGPPGFRPWGAAPPSAAPPQPALVPQTPSPPPLSSTFPPEPHAVPSPPSTQGTSESPLPGGSGPAGEAQVDTKSLLGSLPPLSRRGALPGLGPRAGGLAPLAPVTTTTSSSTTATGSAVNGGFGGGGSSSEANGDATVPAAGLHVPASQPSAAAKDRHLVTAPPSQSPAVLSDPYEDDEFEREIEEEVIEEEDISIEATDYRRPINGAHTVSNIDIKQEDPGDAVEPCPSDLSVDDHPGELRSDGSTEFIELIG